MTVVTPIVDTVSYQAGQASETRMGQSRKAKLAEQSGDS